MGRETIRSTLKQLAIPNQVARVVDRRSQKFAILFRESGRIGSARMLAKNSLKKSLWAACVSLPLAVTAAVLVCPLLIFIGFVPLIWHMAPEIRLRDSVAERREGVERELPLFSVLVNVLGGAGIPLYSILLTTLSSETFSSMKKEALLVRRYVGVFGMDPNDSLDRLAADHPSKKFSEFLLGYTSKTRSGGDVPSYLEAESGALLRELEKDWRKYVNSVGIVGSLMVTIFGVVPLLLLVVGVFSPSFSFVSLALYAGIGVPLFTVLLLYLAARMQPMGEERLAGRPFRSVLLSIGGLVVYIGTGLVWLTVASVIGMVFVSYGITIRNQLAETNDIERGLSKFLKDLLEYKRQEYDMTKAILAIAARTRYNQSFHKLLSRISAQLRAGVPLDDVKLGCRSRLAKLVFLVIGEMSRSGGGTVDSTYQIAQYCGRIVETKKDASAEMKPYLMLSYVSPLLLAFGVTFVGGVLFSNGNLLRPEGLSSQVAGLRTAPITPDLAQVSNLLIVLSAAALGLVGAKISDLTVRNTLRAATNVCLAVAAILCMTLFGSHSLALLVGN